MSEENPTTPEEKPSTEAAPAAEAPKEEEKPLGKPEIQFDDFMKLDLRVATITEAEAHPNADRLLKLQLDVGELGPRQICAGVKAFYAPEDLVGKQIVIIANLKPRKIRGEMSNGMLLAGSQEIGDALELALVTPMAKLPAGATVG